ncbi:hypothetical protein [Pectobacterium versatile]|uniref:hypothetical protein n=1 Tax=Pectobacterium versatile TaxID=2488639 RepID=UPI00102F0E96|nr:hypothetical protein [Pectobacterium versatile]MBN3195709.1 hypothetical protein [Pectobacterium versatile]
MKQKLLFLPLLIISAAITFPAQAVTDSITKSESAKIIFILSTGEGLSGISGFFANSSNFTPGTLNKPKTLTQVRYEIAAYPRALTDSVQLCYLQPYQSLPTRCITVASGSSGTTTQFNDLRFDTGVGLQIRHEVTGRPGDNVRPSRKESVTWDYSY